MKVIYQVLIFFISLQLSAQYYDLGLDYRVLGVFQNNEYFNHIADGYTLVSNQLYPELYFKPIDNFKISIGGFALYYAGQERYKYFVPTFKMSYKYNKHEFIIGTLDNANNHHVLPMLLHPERLLDQRGVEYGVQWKKETVYFPFDLWINWEKMIFKGDDQYEEFIFGISTKYNWLNQKKCKITTPFQNTFYHHGGQININAKQPKKTYTIRNSAIGVLLSYKIADNQQLDVSNYLVDYKNTLKDNPYYFTKGYGYFGELDYTLKQVKIGVAYWQGHNFVSPRGEDMFQSISFKVNQLYNNAVVFSQPNQHDRSLWVVKGIWQKSLLPNLDFKLFTNAFYQNYTSYQAEDTNNKISNQWDFNMGLQLSYKGSFKFLN